MKILITAKKTPSHPSELCQMLRCQNRYAPSASLGPFLSLIKKKKILFEKKKVSYCNFELVQQSGCSGCSTPRDLCISRIQFLAAKASHCHFDLHHPLPVVYNQRKKSMTNSRRFHVFVPGGHISVDPLTSHPASWL